MLMIHLNCTESTKMSHLKSSSARAVKMMQGRAKLPTKVLRPLASTELMMPHLPLRYLV